MRQFFTELEELQRKLLEMAGLVESSIHISIRSLIERTDSHASRVWANEVRINQMEIEVDEIATRLFARNQPVARDLRFLTSAIKINSDLERMGDLAVNIVQRAVSVVRHPPVKPLVDIPYMSKLVESMVRRSLDAFVNRDVELAQAVLESDDEVDDLKSAVYRELILLMEEDRTVVSPSVDLIFIAHNLERIADHATNIAEDTLFFVKAVDVRHRQYPKAL